MEGSVAVQASAAVKVSRRPRFGGGLPLFEGILPLDKVPVVTEVIAGCTLAALAIPETMGYTSIAQMPVITGLYTIMWPVILFAIFGSSRHLVVGADSATAAIMAAGLAGMAAPASPQWVALASTTALMAAVFLILARLLKLGFIANFLSASVLVGFLTGVGFQVAIGQVPSIFGLHKTGNGPVEYLINVGKDLGSAVWGDVAIAAIVIGLIVGLEKVNKRIPGALIAVLGMIALSWAFDFASRGIGVLGDVPSGLPSIGIPQGVTLSDVEAMIATAVSIFIVILAQSAATSRAYAMRYNDSFNENVDLVGLGMANIAAGFTGTWVVNGSPTKTEMVDSAGGRNQIAQLTCAGIVAVVLLFLTKPLSFMPNAVLAGVVFLIGVKLIDYRGMLRIYRLRPGEFVVALITALVVLFIGVEQGILLAIFLSILEHVDHSYHPLNALLGHGVGERLLPLPLASHTQIEPGIAVYRFGASLYYANTSRFTEELASLVEDADPPLKWIVVDAEAISDLDLQAADAVKQVRTELKDRGVSLVFSNASAEVTRLLEANGLTTGNDPLPLFDDVMGAIQAATTAGATPTSEPAPAPVPAPSETSPEG
jgi:high affinity sulfate transporter 1